MTAPGPALTASVGRVGPPEPAASPARRTTIPQPPGGPVWELVTPPSEWDQPARHAVGAHGTTIRFADGTHLLDATSGLWNVNLGYGDETIADAVAGALREASYLTLFRYGHRYATAAADALLDFAGRERYQQVVFATSGGAANDLAMKIARHHAALTGPASRRLVVGLQGSYHGLTYGALSLSGDGLGQALYGANTREIRHVDPWDPAAFRRFAERHGDRTAAVVVEPVLGSGAWALPTEFVAELLRARAEHGFLLVCDEVATGFGRTGRRFASDAWPQAPDLMIVSKGLTNGTCAAAALLLGERAWRPFADHDSPVVHGETQAGTPSSCAAIIAVIERFAALGAVESARRVAARLDAGLREVAAELSIVTGITGLGCFRGVQLGDAQLSDAQLGGDAQLDDARLDEAQVGDAQLRPGVGTTDPTIVSRAIAAVRRHGVLVHPGPGCVQLVPPLVCDDQEVERIIGAVRAGLRDLEQDGPAR